MDGNPDQAGDFWTMGAFHAREAIARDRRTARAASPAREGCACGGEDNCSAGFRCNERYVCIFTPSPVVTTLATDLQRALGDSLKIEVVSRDGGAIHEVDGFEVDVTTNGIDYPAGSALVNLYRGFGYERQTPGFRRLLGVASQVLCPHGRPRLPVRPAGGAQNTRPPEDALDRPDVADFTKSGGLECEDGEIEITNPLVIRMRPSWLVAGGPGWYRADDVKKLHRVLAGPSLPKDVRRGPSGLNRRHRPAPAGGD